MFPLKPISASGCLKKYGLTIYVNCFMIKRNILGTNSVKDLFRCAQLSTGSFLTSIVDGISMDIGFFVRMTVVGRRHLVPSTWLKDKPCRTRVLSCSILSIACVAKKNNYSHAIIDTRYWCNVLLAMLIISKPVVVHEPRPLFPWHSAQT